MDLYKQRERVGEIRSMGKSSCCSKEGLKKGAWTDWEDKILASYINVHGEGKWRNLPKRAGLKRCCRSCRLRWVNYLRPDIKRGNISHDEEELIIRLHNLLGNRWSLIAGRLPGRTDNEIKNYWNSTLSKRTKAQASIKYPRSSNFTHKTIPIESKLKESSKRSAIQTKAIGCSSKVMVPTQPPTSQGIDKLRDGKLYSRNNSQEMGGDIATVEAHNGTQVLDSLNSDGGSVLLSFEINELRKASDGNFEENRMQLLPFDEAMFEDWTTYPYLNDNAATGWDSLAFLIDTNDWP
ncbi:hypothetical protein ES288_D07G021600v1 [Gossypium darwinii]|uniref:Transcription factor TT2 n=1 Tax=Gossypium darwinii TaxID=34276 RepID=A0A5D2BR92_GOSDA|nr:hypothetical protein ES288_D07G021600v1 [Gossypium darwinii]